MSLTSDGTFHELPLNVTDIPKETAPTSNDSAEEVQQQILDICRKHAEQTEDSKHLQVCGATTGVGVAIIDKLLPLS